MDYDTDIFLARQSAQEILLVQLWTALLSFVTDGQTMAIIMREQSLASLSNAVELREGVDPDRVLRVKDLTVLHLEEFWDRIDVTLNLETANSRLP